VRWFRQYGASLLRGKASNNSSTLRDAYEAPAGIMQYTVFGAACLGLLLLFAGGAAAFVLGLRSGSRRA
jgi:hypothetical protein